MRSAHKSQLTDKTKMTENDNEYTSVETIMYEMMEVPKIRNKNTKQS